MAGTVRSGPRPAAAVGYGQRDPDIAVTGAVADGQDCSGGTRFTACMREFGLTWARRVAGGRWTVPLISDGLEHSTPNDRLCKELRFEMAGLHKSCPWLIWLNRLLRFDASRARAVGILAMRPNVDLFLRAHNLESLQQLGHVQGGRQPTADRPSTIWRNRHAAAAGAALGLSSS